MNCEKCGKEIVDGSWDFCDECIEKAKTIENCIDIGSYYEEELLINGFWCFCFNEKKIDEILRSAFDSLPIGKRKKLIRNYCEDDMLYFVRYMKKNEKRKNCLFKR